MKKVYKFDSQSDMIALAQAIQIKVYWGSRFYLEEESIPYKDFWDYCENAFNENYVAVRIDENDEVTFLRSWMLRREKKNDIISIVSTALFAVAFFLAVGAIGSYENNALSSVELLRYELVALALSVVSFLGFKNCYIRV